MTSFVEVQFPTNISLGASGGPEYSTDIIKTFGGWEQRNINWSQPIGRWNVASGIKSNADIESFINFFRARRGRAVAFRFKDWNDYAVTSGNIGTGDGTDTTFQLRKQYTSGSVTVNRTITKPVSSSYMIYVNGVSQTETTDYSINTTTGLVTFVTPPTSGHEITADFQFDVPARFDTDFMDLSAITNNLKNWPNIPIVEIRVE